jgi:hypothetical protein
MTEQWRPVVGYEGLYEVSSHGRVKRVKASPGTRAGKILRNTITNTGYFTCAMCVNGTRKTFLVHRLVAFAFVDGDTSLTVNHKDGDKTNNVSSNLEWITQSENTKHSFQTGLANTSTQFKPYKIPPSERQSVRDLVASGMSQAAVAKKYDCSTGLIHSICKRRIK